MAWHSLHQHFFNFVSLKFANRKNDGSLDLCLKDGLIELLEGWWLFYATVVVENGCFHGFSYLKLFDQFWLFAQISENGSKDGKELVPFTRGLHVFGLYFENFEQKISRKGNQVFRFLSDQLSNHWKYKELSVFELFRELFVLSFEKNHEVFHNLVGYFLRLNYQVRIALTEHFGDELQGCLKYVAIGMRDEAENFMCELLYFLGIFDLREFGEQRYHHAVGIFLSECDVLERNLCVAHYFGEVIKSINERVLNIINLTINSVLINSLSFFYICTNRKFNFLTKKSSPKSWYAC